MPTTPEHSAKLAALKQVKSDLSDALKNNQRDVVTAKYNEQKALLKDLQASRKSK